MGGRPGRSCKDRRQIQINIFHSVNVFSAVFEKCCGNSRGCYCATDSGRRRTDLCVREDVGRFGITEGSNVFEPFCVFCNIGNNIQEIEDCGQPQSDTNPAFPEERGDTETDSSYFCLKQKIGQVMSYARRQRRFSFRELLEGQGDKLEIVVTFLAVLELMKIGKIHLSQEETLGDMDIETLEPEGEEEDLDLEGLDDFAG